MKQTKRSMVKRIEAFLFVVVFLLVSLAPGTAQAATQTMQSVEEIDFADFSNWRSGVYYYTNGKYSANVYRICLNDYVTFSGDEYKVHLTDNQFHLLIRELNASKNFLRSYDLVNGQTYKPGINAEYLAISVYKYANGETGMSYEVYKEKFANGFVAELCPVKSTATEGNTSTVVPDIEQDTEVEEETETVVKKAAVEDTDLTDFANWRTGQYSWTTGVYERYGSRICLNDYVTYKNDSYKVSISNSKYQMLIREMDKNLKFIKSYDLKNGTTYTPSSDTEYLAISIYNPSNYGLSFTDYKNLFVEGLKVKLVVNGKTDAGDDEEVESDVQDKPDTNTSTNNSTNNGTSNTQKQTIYELIADMIINADTSVKDISSYKVTYYDFYNKIVPQVKEEYYIEAACYRNMYFDGNTNGIYMVDCKMNNVDADAKNRIARTKQAVKDFMASVAPQMKDLDKILFAHEYIVNRTNYQFDDAGTCYYAGGPLGNGAGVCSGYTKALNLLLNEMGIETDYVSSKSMNHAWTYVKVDGAWYHIDSTWDDTRKGSYSKYMHRFLLRTDDEFTTQLTGNLHTGYTKKTVSAAATSTRFSDWYVHDVAGSMYYYNGMWYYWDINTNSILCSNIEGTVTKVVVDGSNSGTITLKGISGKVLTYTIGSTQYSRTL